MTAPDFLQTITLQTFIEAWKTWDYKRYLAILSDNVTQVMLPSSMGVPARGRAEVEHILPILMTAVTNYKLTIHHVLHDAEKNQAAIYSTAKGDAPFGEWDVESVIFLTFSAAGDRVAKIEEMMDSAKMQELMPRVGRYIQEQSLAGANGHGVGVGTE
ncbi:hypothetical protein COCMIDRAFT_106796 [Bipolaris oryzae ATCC 44560]|uniref:SnoaL-like domain-containing protein n=1 Tax=Bipolaris oryzae ATCC 44560 TaxID=930090 RepID=W6Z0J8_COCMI|nr:uncharacterized protein COCMIDRAFT_106796 [Bipolaris oryzae ATCC 44560]EUC41194.1 hypothetical protein COCMIDRAFT_106796 [Bipolaris oryzae ATCC 44560]